MAELSSTYVFEREDDYNEAVDHLERLMHDDRYNDDCIRCWGYDSGVSAYRIDIYSGCSDAPRAAAIIREHRGKYRY